MERIDEKLREDAVPIHARGMHAGLEYSRRFHLEFPMACTGQTGTPGNYSDSNVDAHIRDWFSRRYGDRQNIFMGPGKTALLIRGDPWELRLPLIMGQAECVVERNVQRYANQPPLGENGRLPVVNVLSLIESFPQGLAAQLTDSERWSVLNVFRDTLDCMNAIDHLRDAPFLAEVRADIGAAVAHIFAVPPHYGQSKWASCQASEKLLKSFLKTRGVPFPRNHDLLGLTELARTAGASLDDTIVSHASVSAGARYGEIRVSSEAAVHAHHASLLIGRQIYAALRGV